MYLCLNQFPYLLKFCGPYKRLCLFYEFSDQGYNEVVIELRHTIKHLYLLWICKYKHVYYDLYFLGIQQFRSLETINLRIILEEAIKMHCCGLRLIPYFCIFQGTISILTYDYPYHCMQQIIQKDLHELVQVFLGDPIHYILVSWWSIESQLPY